MITQQGFECAYLLGAVNPNSGQHVGLVFEDLDTEVVNEHLRLVSQAVPTGVHVLLVWDQAGYHKSKSLVIPDNITVFRLEPYSLELNPVERVWGWLKRTLLGNRSFKNIEDIFQAGIQAWSELTDEFLTTLCRVSWIPCKN